MFYAQTVNLLSSQHNANRLQCGEGSEPKKGGCKGKRLCFCFAMSHEYLFEFNCGGRFVGYVV